ncbi:MAG: CopG family transcriptional regulator [bacterium]
MRYRTTNIRFPEDQYTRLKHLAVERRKSLSFLVRDAVAKAYVGEVEKAAEPFDIRKDPFWKFVGSVNDPSDRYGSERHDDIYDENEFTSDAALRIQREHRKNARAGHGRRGTTR